MGTAYPPDGWTVGSGVWGTDFDQETTVVYAGPTSVKFQNTTPAADPWLRTPYEPTVPGDVWLGQFIVRASSIAGGNTVECGIGFLDKNDAWVSDLDIYASAVLAAADTWYVFSGSVTAPAGAVKAYGFTKKNNTAFYLYQHMMGIRKMPKCFFVTMAGDDTVSGGAEKMAFDTESYDHGSAYDAAVNYRFTAPCSGVYSFDAFLNIKDVPAAKYIGASFYKNGALWMNGVRSRNDSAGIRDMECAVHISSALLLVGDYIELYANTNDAGPLTVSAARSWFSGQQIT